MKTNLRPNLITRVWRRIVGRSGPPYDLLLSMNITLFNFSTGRDRLLKKQQTVQSGNW